MHPARQFRELLQQPGPILSPGVYDCLSAKVVERVGFPAASISGAALTASMIGYPDVGVQSYAEVLNAARNIAQSVGIPVLVDGDTGFGGALNVMRATHEFEAAGLAGMMIEDQVFPKRCGHFEGKKLISAKEMVVKIQAVLEARREGFVLIARTDANATDGLEEAIRRGQLYAEAGADLVFVEALLDVDEMRRVAASIRVPLKVNLNEGSKTPSVNFTILHEMGYKLINYSGLLQRSALGAMLDVLEALRADGSTANYKGRLCTMIERSRFLGLESFYQIEERLYGPITDSPGSWRDQLQ